MNRVVRQSRRVGVSARWVRSENNGMNLEAISRDEAGHKVFQFPAEYEPHSFNYHSNGLFLGLFCMMSFAYVSYEADWLNETGQVKRG